jgi:cytochrome c556
MKKSVCIGLLLLGCGATAAMADIITDRENLMKSFGPVGRTLGGMAKGTTPFDAAAAKTQLQILVDGAAKIPTMFPAGSNTPPTLALPTVWSDSTGFSAAAAKLGKDATAAQGATDAASFTAAYQTVQGDCGACHKVYRAPLPPPAAAPPAQ